MLEASRNAYKVERERLIKLGHSVTFAELAASQVAMRYLIVQEKQS